MKTRPNRTIIHVSIRLPSRFSLINNKLQSSNRNTKRNDTLPQNLSCKISDLIKTSDLSRSRSSKVAHHDDYHNIVSFQSGISEPIKSENNTTERRDVANDCHRKSKRNKKLKCSRRYFIASLLTTFLLALIIIAILLVLLIKPKTTSIPDTAVVLRWNKIGITIVGGLGNGNNQLNTPFDAVVDYANNLYVVDQGNHRVQKYSFGSSIGETVAGNETYGSSSNRLHNPSKVVIDSNENLYISDTYRNRIQFWRKVANVGITVAGTMDIAGNASNQLNSPYGIALHPTTSTLYISDYANHRIMSYPSGTFNGTLIFGSGVLGLNNTQLYYPVGLCYDLFSNSLIIANHMANNVVRFVLGANHWELLAGSPIGVPDITSDRLRQPVDMTLDPMGNLYVADRNNHRIQFFSNGQLNGTTIAGVTGVFAANATTLYWPWSVKLDSQLNLYVADTYNNRIQKFLRY